MLFADLCGFVNCWIIVDLDFLSIFRTLALELGPYGIRVNSINPTVVKTELALTAGWGDPVKADALKSKIPLRKFCEITDVTNLIMYLLSDQSDMVTGAIVPLDGGYSA